MRPRLTLRSIVVGVALLSLAVAADARAQEGDDTNWLRVDIVQVRPEKLDDYIELQLEEVNPALQRAGVPFRSAWRTAEFGNTYERVFATPIGSLADFDTGGPLARAIDPDRLARLRDRVRECLVGRQSYLSRNRPSLSVESDDPSGLFLLRIATIQIAPGRAADWEAFLQDNLPRFRGADVVFAVYERVFGPGPTTWQIVENHASFAELAQPSILERTFGEQADAVAATLGGVVQSVERTVLRYDAELSYSSIPSSTQQQED